MIAFVYTTVTLWSIHGDLPSTLTHEQTDDWQQPIAANTLFPSAISAQQWHFDYESTENILANVEVSNTGELLINPELLCILTKVIDSLPPDMSDQVLQRIGLLISKSFSHRPHTAKTLTDVLINFYHLSYAENKVHTVEKNTQSTREKLKFFLTKEARKNYYLGKDVASKLFSNQQDITRYLLERKIIKENAALSTQQKKQQLDALSKPMINTVKRT
ncbi:MAG: hypothetical protein ACI910_001163 [Oleispira sp.]